MRASLNVGTQEIQEDPSRSKGHRRRESCNLEFCEAAWVDRLAPGPILLLMA